MTSVEHIEIKVANGVQVYSAQEVVYLLNLVRMNSKALEELNRTRKKRDDLALDLERALKEIKRLRTILNSPKNRIKL
jgi:chromosome segregation ATPase